MLAYALDNASSAVQSLNTGATVTDSFQVVAVDQTNASGSITVTFEIEGADEGGNSAPDTFAPWASGDEDNVISVSIYGSDSDGSVVAFRITDTSGLNGTLYADW